MKSLQIKIRTWFVIRANILPDPFANRIARRLTGPAKITGKFEIQNSRRFTKVRLQELEPGLNIQLVATPLCGRLKDAAPANHEHHASSASPQRLYHYPIVS